MTIEIVEYRPNELVLTDSPDQPTTIADSYGRPLMSGIHVHVRPTCPIKVRIHLDDDRAVVKFDNDTTDVALFLSTAQISRLIGVLVATRDRLTGTAALAGVAHKA